MKRRYLLAITMVSFLFVFFLLLSPYSTMNRAFADNHEGVTAATDFLSKLSNSLSEVSSRVTPSVVNISTTMTVTAQETPFGELFNDPFFRRFFGTPFGPEQKYRTTALGSGVIVSKDGYILTNNHVVKNAEKIKVILYDKRQYDARVIGTDPKTDLAVIKIDEKNLPAIKIGNSDRLRVGDVVLAIGNPFGLSHTVTMGIVSAVGRSNIGLADYEDFIQTDAAINPGNSGGALVNAKGELVGINTAIFSKSGGYMGIGFAIPSNMAKAVMESIIKYGKVIRGWLGVTIQNITPEIAKHLGIKANKGALVTDVVKGSPADSAGLKRGDLIVEYNGNPVNNTTELRNMVAQTRPGKIVELKIIRDGREITMTVTIGELPEKLAEAGTPAHENILKGVYVQNLTPQIREELSIPSDVQGVVVTNVDEDSPAYGILRRGDVITEVNRREIKDTKDFENALSGIGGNESVLLLVYRHGGYVYLTIKP
ncbi:MAG TPA: DegQ family serine endoprotease [Nitrospirae bacterium]|nr:DegQ family serine endoprotease [Nitrospirota bacterium]